MSNVGVYDTKDIIYALATGWATAPIAVIRVSGKGSIEKIAPLFNRPDALLRGDSHTVVHGELCEPKSKERIDEVLITLFRGGRGYTKEESLEISCHGNQSAIKGIFTLLEEVGFRSALPGEFTFRAFVNGRIDLTQAEAVMEVISSQSKLGHSLALNRLEGGLFSLIEEIKHLVLQAVGVVEIQLDYAEDEIIDDVSFPFETIEESQRRIESLLSTFEIGRLYQEGAKVVLAGPTNAGKSTLFNLLLKQERSIVSETHGTTRDFIEAKTVIEEIPVTLYDTAGLRDATSSVEQEGIRRTHTLLEQADLILLMLDGSDDNHSLELYSHWIEEKRCIVVWNKSDIATANPIKGSFPISAKKGEGFIELLDEIVKRLKVETSRVDSSAIVIESIRQRNELTRANKALEEAVTLAKDKNPLDIVAIELQEALHALGSLTGEVASAELLEHIFGQFCVGK